MPGGTFLVFLTVFFLLPVISVSLSSLLSCILIFITVASSLPSDTNPLNLSCNPSSVQGAGWQVLEFVTVAKIKLVSLTKLNYVTGIGRHDHVESKIACALILFCFQIAEGLLLLFFFQVCLNRCILFPPYLGVQILLK